jgi:hypothetical protein
MPLQDYAIVQLDRRQCDEMQTPQHKHLTVQILIAPPRASLR